MKTCVLAVSITLAAAAGHAHAQLSSASIRQLNLLGTQTSTPNSGWGELEFSYTGEGAPRYLNVQFNGQWVIQNAPLGVAGIGDAQSRRVQFPLGATGPLTGTWGVELLDAPVTTFTPGSVVTGAVPTLDYRIGTEAGIDLGSLDAPAPLVVSAAGAAGAQHYTVPGMHRFKNQEQPRNHCAPGAVSNSLSWLKSLGKVPESTPTSIEFWAERFGTTVAEGSPQSWYEIKGQYFRDHPEFGVEQTTIEYGSDGWLTRLLEAVNDRRDIELDLDGHVAVVREVVTFPDREPALWIYDDNQANDGQDLMRLVFIENGKVGRMDVQRFVVEIPAPASVPALGGVFALLAVRRRRTRA